MPIYISELDINLEDDNTQLNKFQSLFPLFYEHPAVEGITLWGYLAGQTWKEFAYLLGTNNILGTWTLNTTFADYSATGSGIVQVHFTNDKVDNTNDVEVDFATLDGTVYQAEDMPINTGVWQNSTCGGLYSSFMHCNGNIEFPEAVSGILFRARGITVNEIVELQTIDYSVEKPALQWLRYDYFGNGNPGGAEVIAEAEDGLLYGVTTDNSRTGYSSTGYVTDFDDYGDYVQVDPDLLNGGDFTLAIGYASDNAISRNVSVNGNVVNPDNPGIKY